MATSVNPAAPSTAVKSDTVMAASTSSSSTSTETNSDSITNSIPTGSIQGQPPCSDFDTFQRGIKVMKWVRGPPVGRHIRQLKITDDYSAITWQSKGQDRVLKISEIVKVAKGLSNFSKDAKNPAELEMSFTVHANNAKDLEVTAVKTQDFNILFNVIKYLKENPKESL